MNFLHAMLFAILQGATELFPVSSLGHAVVVPAVLHWHINQAGPGFLPFLVMLHFGTAIGMLAYFRVEWIAVLRGVLGQGYAAQVQAERRFLLAMVLATLPAVVVGFTLKKTVAHLFASPLIACGFLVANAGLLLLGERLRGRSAARGKAISNRDALVIGLFQCLAFLPGISRSGAAIVGAVRRGVAYEEAAKFSFMIGTPVIFAASVLEVPKLLHAHELHALFGTAVLAAIVAGLVAYASTAFLMRYFRNHEAWGLQPFAWYCGIFGAGSFLLLLAGL